MTEKKNSVLQEVESFIKIVGTLGKVGCNVASILWKSSRILRSVEIRRVFLFI